MDHLFQRGRHSEAVGCFDRRALFDTVRLSFQCELCGLLSGWSSDCVGRPRTSVGGEPEIIEIRGVTYYWSCVGNHNLSCSPTILAISNQKDIYQEVPVNFVTTFIDGFMRVWQVSTGKGVGIVVRKLWRPKFRIPCAADVILDDVAGLSSNHKKALTQRGAINKSSAPTRMNSEE
ncbi:hypothetical protein BGZ88_003117 [Linnemannia elongata]|nr:hypothetical protein BGZ88_003117 [Linnemannia elongata]